MTELRATSEDAAGQAKTVEMNEALLLGSLRQHELTEAAETTNERLRAEMEVRRRAEEALRQSEEHYRAFVSASSQVVYQMNSDWSEMRQLHGRDFIANTESPSRNWLQEYILPEDQPRVLAAIQEAIRTKSIFEWEHRVRQTDGTVGWMSSRVVPLLDPHGEITEWFGAGSNVTQRKLAEETLHRNEALFSTLIDQAPGAVFVLDSALCFHQLNPQTRAVFGHLGQLLGRPFAEVMEVLWGREVTGRIMDIFRHTLETGERFLAPRFSEQRHDLGVEQTYDYETQRVSLPNGTHGVVCYFSDITERTRAAEALRASEQQFASIFNQTTSGIGEMSLDGRFVLVNDRLCQLLQRSRAEVLALRLPEVTHPEDLEASREQLEQLLARAVPSFVLELRLLRPDGSSLWTQADVAPILDPDNQVQFITVALTDISERRVLEDWLVARASELAQADRSKDEFLAMLAHELRNPLAPLRNAAEILRTEGVTPAERDLSSQIIARQIENMTRMIDDLLDVSRITEGKIDLRRQPVTLEAILTSATSLVRAQCAARQQELTVSLPSLPVYLDADATRLEQVFSNLLGNACKYSGYGCHISLRAELVVDAKPPEVIVHVQDDGVGIAPELLPRVFDLFVQATRSLDRAHGGLGIGLTLVDRLVRLHGGRVEARSGGLGCGSDFIVHLPIVGEAPPPPPLPAPVAREIPRRILIVDDNTDSARSMAILQNRRGHQARTAFTGPDALSVAAEFLPEVVLLDIGLPGMDGFEVARHLREMPALAGALLIAMTGYASLDDRIAAKQAGFDEHLVKPVDLALLSERMHKLAGERGDAAPAWPLS